MAADPARPLQLIQRPADGDQADPDAGGQLSVGGQQVAGHQAALGHEFLDVGHDPFIQQLGAGPSRGSRCWRAAATEFQDHGLSTLTVGAR